MTKPCVIHLIKSLNNGGCENSLLRVLPLITAYHHVVITMGQPGALAQKFRNADIQIESPDSIISLIKLIKKIKPDLVITYMFHADVLGRLLLPFFVSCQIVPFLRTTYNHPRYLVARLFERATRPLVKKYFANSIAVKNYYSQHYSISPHVIMVIPNGIDVSQYRSSTLARKSMRSELCIPSGAVVGICVANFHPNKGHATLLRAFGEISDRFPDFHLLLVGSGETLADLKEEVSRSSHRNKILFLGQRTDIPGLLSASDIFILPTIFEGQSNAIIEAMAAGLPVVTSDIPENRTLITHQSNGVLVMPGDHQGLARAISTLINSPKRRRKIGNNARSSISRSNSLNASRTAFSRAINRII